MVIEESQIISKEDHHSVFQAFKHKNFSLYFWGQGISMVGTWSQMLAISWLVWRLTSSATWLGFANFATQIPIIVFGLIGGAITDRYDRLRSLVLMQALCMLQAVILGILALTGKVGVWEVIILSSILGIVYSFEWPIRNTFIMDMVGRKDLLNAISLNVAMFHATRILGPVVAGFIVAWKGEGICFLFNALTFLFLIIILLLFVDRSMLLKQNKVDSDFFKSIIEGIRHMLSNREAKYSLVMMAVLSGIGMQFITLMPIYADRIFKGGAVHLGWLMGAGGLGAFLGALWLSRQSSRSLFGLIIKSGFIFSLALVVFSRTSNLWVALPIIILMGFFLTNVFASTNTLLQQSTPDYLRGRIMGIFTITFVGLNPFGSLIVGYAAERINVTLVLVTCGIICLLVSSLFWIFLRRSTPTQSM